MVFDTTRRAIPRVPRVKGNLEFGHFGRAPAGRAVDGPAGRPYQVTTDHLPLITRHCFYDS